MLLFLLGRMLLGDVATPRGPSGRCWRAACFGWTTMEVGVCGLLLAFLAAPLLAERAAR